MAEEEDLTAAVQSVRQLEAQLEGMVRPQSELQQCLELEKREHRRTAAKLRQLLDRKDKPRAPVLERLALLAEIEPAVAKSLKQMLEFEGDVEHGRLGVGLGKWLDL